MLVQVVVEQGADGVVGRCHGMEVTREVQIDFFHRQHLGIAATSSTALHAKAGTERRLKQGYGGFLSQLIQSQCQSDADGGLADTRLGGTNGCHKNQPALLYLLFVDERHRDLGHVASVRFYLLRVDTQLGCNLADGLQFAFPCNLYVSLHNLCTFS